MTAEQPGESGAVRLTDDERLRISAVVHQNYYMPDVFALVEQIVGQRMPAASVVVEWNVSNAHGDLSLGRFGTTESSARITQERSSQPRYLMRHERTTYTDTITDWERVDSQTPTGAHP